MNQEALRKLHKVSGSSDPFGYWYATKLLEFRRLFGLKYRPCTPEESKALLKWLMTNS